MDPLQSIPTREIMWNVSATINTVFMYVLFALSLLIGFFGIFQRIELWCSGKSDASRIGNWKERFKDLFINATLQKKTVRKREPAIFHSLIYIGFLILLFTTTMVLIDHDLGFKIYNGDFYLIITILSDVFGLGLLVGIFMAWRRRIIKKADLVHTTLADNFILFSLALLVIQGFFLEGIRIVVTQDPWSHYSPVGEVFGLIVSFLPNTLLIWFHFLIWWFHTLTVFGIIAVTPYTKFFHILSSSCNLYFQRNRRPKGQLHSPGDIEKLMEDAGDSFTIGRGTIKDYTWKELLDLDACTSCGRCQDVCPAYISGKPLSPKWVILDSRNHMLALRADDKLDVPSLLPSFITPLVKKIDSILLRFFQLYPSGLKNYVPEKSIKTTSAGYTTKGIYRAKNKLVQESVKILGRNADDRISGDVIDPSVFWSCTTCMACVEACPVGINHVDQIVGNRQNMALMHGEIPHEAQATLRAIETRGNPYGPQSERLSWLKDLAIDVKILNPGDSVDYLYWVGCVSSFDKRKQKIARALVKIMQRAGLDFGILGEAEGCSGDPARRLGEENLFQMQAKSNLEVLKSIRFKVLVANCPHCFNTIKNEYPEFGNLGNGEEPEIIHHSILLRRLIDQGSIVFKQETENHEYTFHDPCYLGRYNDEYEAPRKSLTAIPGFKILEMERNRNNGLCCGAGGGHFWMDLKIGDRVNAIRTDEACNTGAKKIATACPFCLQMMEDGVKITGRDAELEVKDVAEVVAENLM
jgi:Fe-S oxidoreductase/nitrate reductase gamma subunit